MTRQSIKLTCLSSFAQKQDKRLRLIGLYFKTILEQLVAPMAAKPFPNLGMSKVEIETLVARVKQDLGNVRYHGYFEYIFWTGQKPA